MSDNMNVWNKLSITDPKHTKKFKRAGGFSGDAIKPMYAIQKMTEAFGPCGEGWGYTKPEYQIVDGTEGQKLVYCTVGLWHSVDPESYPQPQYIWGVGGDFIIIKQSSGLRSDDEAFKKSFTDALMNAMKHIGMSADVHMGQFDGSKYDAEKPAQSNPLAPERVTAIIQYINDAKDDETVVKLHASAKEECMKAEDEPSYNKITEAAKIKRKQLKGE